MKKNLNSRIALGTVQFGLDYGINNARGKVPKQEVFKILDFASKNGIELIDTAHVYGDSEKVLGQFFREKTSRFKVVSKLPPATIENAEDFFNESLERLNLKKIFGFLFHDFESFHKNPGIWHLFRKLKAQRRIEKIGFSLYYPREAEFLLKHGILPDIVQIPYSVFDQRFAELLPALKGKGIEIHARSVFLQGLVFKNPENLEKFFLPIKEKLALLHSLAEAEKIPVSALCINFALLNGCIDKVILGIDSLQNLRENLSALALQKRIKNFYGKLLDLKEDNENLILPIHWKK